MISCMGPGLGGHASFANVKSRFHAGLPFCISRSPALSGGIVQQPNTAHTSAHNPRSPPNLLARTVANQVVFPGKLYGLMDVVSIGVVLRSQADNFILAAVSFTFPTFRNFFLQPLTQWRRFKFPGPSVCSTSSPRQISGRQAPCSVNFVPAKSRVLCTLAVTDVFLHQPGHRHFVDAAAPDRPFRLFATSSICSPCAYNSAFDLGRQPTDYTAALPLAPGCRFPGAQEINSSFGRQRHCQRRQVPPVRIFAGPPAHQPARPRYNAILARTPSLPPPSLTRRRPGFGSLRQPNLSAL